MGGHRKRLLEPHRALVIDRLKAVPDLTFKALVAELAERGIATCPASVWRLVRSAGMSFKKSLFAYGGANQRLNLPLRAAHRDVCARGFVALQGS